MLETRFQGFSPEFSRFLFELPFNNTVERQAENLVPYKKWITQPLRLLYEEILPVIEEIDPALETKPARCISTPYTDRRFSPSVPLKDYMYLKFRYAGKTEDVPGLYFDMGCDGYSYGCRMYRKTPAGMKALREKIAADPTPWRNALERALACGFSVYGEQYKRDHCPEISDAMTKELLNRKYFCLGVEKPLSDSVFTADFAGEIASAFRSLSEMLHLLMDA